MTMQDNKTSIEVLKVKVDNIIEDVKSFVSLDRFQPIEKIVWTLVILVITSVVGAGLTVIFK